MFGWSIMVSNFMIWNTKCKVTLKKKIKHNFVKIQKY